MHGWVQRDSESCRSLGRSSSQHMRSVLPSETTHNTVAVAGDNHSPPASSITTSPSGDSFFKDGRKISVGDCALFKPDKVSPPFIGLIRSLALNKENNLQLGVNWLYRSSELKLGKGHPVDSAPNEIFYSFHKDEIPAASLLHPCKVAFLHRGVELPPGASSFVCRRAYDIANKRLRWLTDQDYINEQQEVNQLLSKTGTEMHVTLQPGGRSPKQVNGPTSTSQLKPASDSGQNGGTSFPSQAKGKKRERGDHGADPVKRERSSSRTDDGDSVQCKTETNLKNEITRITDKGGVVDLEGVEKLVQLMQLDRKMDLLSRSMLASVMASTDKVDCLNHFVQLRGLRILDEWLQDIHKGKIGDGNNLKAGDKPVEEFLLVLLRALDKLPVNLQALQMCNIGRSVNHLRSHKNVEIQRKARTLVDTWKKRVEAEMISNDAKSGSTQAAAAWPSKSRLPEASHGGSRTPSGSDVAVKSSISQNSGAKTASVRSSHGESSIKYATSSPGSVKPASSIASGKESQPGNCVGGTGTADTPQIREDRSGSSNQSHNYGQSSSAKEDVKSSTSGSVTVNKTSTSSTRNRKVSGFPGTSATGGHKEASSSKISSAQKNSAPDKLSHSALTTSERVVEGAISEGSSHKLIVKIPNRGRSPAQGASGGSLEDPTSMGSRASSPVLSNKHEQADHASKDKSDTYQCNVASEMNVCQTNDQKDALARSEGAESPAILPEEVQSMTTDDSRRIIEGLPINQLKSVKLHASSFSPMNALIESCVKYSESTSSLSLEDDVGMNLLASVAAGEMSRSDVVSPTGSTERSIHAVEEVCTGDEAKSTCAPEEYIAGVRNQFYSESECDGKKEAVLDGCSWSDDGSNLSKHTPNEFSGDRKCAPSNYCEDIAAGEDIKDFGSSSTVLRSNADHKLETGEKPNEKTDTTCSAPPISMDRVRDVESNEETLEERATFNVVADSISNCRNGGIDVMVTEEKDSTERLSIDGSKPVVEVAGSKPLDEGDCTKFVNEGLNRTTNSEQKLAAAIVKSQFAETANFEKLHQAECGLKSLPEAGDAVKVGKLDDGNANSCMGKSDRLNFDKEMGRNAAGERHTLSVSCSTSPDLNSYHIEAKLENQEIPEHISLPASRSPGLADDEAQEEAELTGPVSAIIYPDEAGKYASAPIGAEAASSSAAGATDPGGKLKFDLNEGLSADDAKYGESVTSTSSGPTTVHVVNSLPFSANSIPSGHSASVTIAAAATKGPFVPPEDLLRSRVELGWKGSAATSAFRPAEPRKVLETPLAQTKFSSSDVSTRKHDRIPLDIDLNVPDERVLQEMACRDSALAVDSTNNCATLLNEASDSLCVRGGGGLDLDLNRVDDTNDTGHCSTSSNHNGEASALHVKPLGGSHGRRDFDLNNGPVVDDASAEQFPFISQLVRGGITSQLPASGLRMNSPMLGSFSSWFPPGNTYSTVAIPSVLPDRGEQPFSVFPPGAQQRTFGPAGVTPFNPDAYRGSVLSSSPAVPYPSSPFQIPVFPFGTTFPLPLATFSVGATSYADSSSAARPFAPPVNSQYLGPVGSVTSQFQRPYVVSLPDIGNNSGLENNKQWGSRQGLDLNTGPGAMESEVREEMLPLSSGQHSVASSQGLVEEHARMFSVSGGLLKRKEPDGGWDNETLRRKQSSWQ